MNNDMRTAEKFMQAVNAMKDTLDTQALERDIELEIAGRHNLRRKLRMIRSMKHLYAHLHGNAPKPRLLPSEAFDPFEGVDKTNIHYMFKAMTAVPPWELRRDLLVVPTAVTLLMLEIATKLFPAPQVFALTLLMEEFVNRWTLPKRRNEWSDDDEAHEFADYRADMGKIEERMKKAYTDLSLYFGGIETPRKNPVVKKINETHKRTKALAEKANQLAQKADLAVYEASGQNPVYKPGTANGISAIKQLMVDMALSELKKSDALSERSVCAFLLERFSGIDGAYTNLDSFRKQVTRAWSKLGHFR